MEVLDFLNGLKGSVDIHSTDLTTKVLRKDKADSTNYNLSVAASAAMDNAVRKSELIGGLLRPYRLFPGVGSADVGASVRSGQDAKIADGFGLGQAYKITTIKITTITAPGLASTITIKSNNVVVYTQTVALTNIPAVGKIIDLLGFATSQPTNITLPTTLTCSASSGTFEVFVDGVLI